MISTVYISKYDSEFQYISRPEDGDFQMTVTVAYAKYSIDAEGYLYPDVRVAEPKFWSMQRSLITSLREHQSENFGILVIVDSDTIAPGDVYDVYSIDADVEMYTYVMYWSLRFRKYQAYGSPHISLINVPDICPMCDRELHPHQFVSGYSKVHTESGYHSIRQCRNLMCYGHMISAATRYINIACDLPQYTLVVKNIVHADLIKSPADLYSLEPEELNGIGISEQYANRFLEDLAETRGNIRFSSYLRALPLVDYLAPGFMIYTRRIDEAFSKLPHSFINWLIECGDPLFRASEHPLFDETGHITHYMPDERFYRWREIYAERIAPYLSTTAFLSYYLYFDGTNTEYSSMILVDLENLGVFSRVTYGYA